ncbi:hypothetical protein JQC91_01550 [Jannaschia sp. Os4]|uniref:hypothetical protein n=1 Tax=Jannaschia sp. Os4 TaxID=2807617 RepID=UPI0019398D06|nr:hypothetical protein [Jannaschia sp. Os4]MBM2574977.1 hypothetical protein [Jannaschia sp. Os4]
MTDRTMEMEEAHRIRPLELDRIIAETGKINAETLKLVAEQQKLRFEGANPDRARLLAPFAAAAAVIDASVAATILMLRLFGAL